MGIKVAVKMTAFYIPNDNQAAILQTFQLGSIDRQSGKVHRNVVKIKLKINSNGKVNI